MSYNVSHFKFMVIVFLFQGQPWPARHLCCSFGAVGSITACHRGSSFIKHVMITSTRLVFGKYVDDFFRFDLQGLQGTTPKLLNPLCLLIGSPCDPGKAAYHMTEMAMLGAQVFIDFATWSYHHRVALENAKWWAAELKEINGARQLNSCIGAKIKGGKLKFANQLAHGRFGRAFLRLLMRCIHAPLPNYHIQSFVVVGSCLRK